MGHPARSQSSGAGRAAGICIQPVYRGCSAANNGLAVDYRHGPKRHYGWYRGNHYGWSRGQRMGYNDWRYAQRVDYRRYNLRQPPRGYEWRRNDDRFLMVAIATGLIASVIISNGR